jgi:type IV secretion system protein VirD4
MSTTRILFLIVVAAALGAFLIVDRLWLRTAKPNDGARFAHPRELRMLRTATGIALGYHRGKALHAEPNASVLLCGPSQAGKSRAAVARAILEWQGPLLVLSIKEELLRWTVEHRSRLGEVRVFDPCGLTSRAVASWSPPASSSSWSQARAIAAGLLQIGQEADLRDREPHWRRTAAAYLAPLLLAAHVVREPIRTVLSWVHTHEQDAIVDILARTSAPNAREALENLEHIWRSDARYQSSVLGTLSTALDAFQEPSVAQATATDDISPQWLCGAQRTLYVVAPASQQRRLQSLFGGLLVYLLDGALGIAQRSPGGRLEAPLLACLDELANVAPIPTLGEYASSGAGQGLVLMSVLQDLSQAVATFGRERAMTIVSNHRAKLLWSGIGDPETLQWVDRVLGSAEHERRSHTDHKGGRSTTRGSETRPLLPPHRLRQGKQRTALLVYGQLPPVWTDQPLAVKD